MEVKAPNSQTVVEKIIATVFIVKHNFSHSEMLFSQSQTLSYIRNEYSYMFRFISTITVIGHFGVVILCN